MSSWWWKSRRCYKGKHICITGGSEGLGFALASLFIKEKGTRVSLIARTQHKLETALKNLTSIIDQQNLDSKVFIFQGDCAHYESIQQALDRVQKEVGFVDVLICNAGTSHPGRFIDCDVSAFEAQMKTNYLGTVHTIKSVINSMVQNKKGEIVIISSALGVLGMSGYTAYAPTKWALRGFADCLRMEMQAHDIRVRIAYPPSINTPGFREEVKSWPPEIFDMMKAAGDSAFEPNVVAKAIVCGMKRNLYHLPSPDFLQTLSQAGMTGLTPSSFFLPLQSIINMLCVFIYAVFVNIFDRIARNHTRNA